MQKARLELFRRQLAAMPPMTSTSHASKTLKAQLIIACDRLSEIDDLVEAKNSTDLGTALRSVDNGKGTFTPDIYNEESKQIFILYLNLLRDIDKHWSDYIPFTTSCALTVLGIPKRISQSILLMESQLELYQRRESSSLVDSQIYKPLNSTINDFFATCQQKINNDEQVTEDDLQNFFQCYQTTMKLPKTLELSAVINCDTPDSYAESNSRSFTGLGQAYLIESLLAVETKLNQLRKSKQKSMVFSDVTPHLQKFLNPISMASFESKVTRCKDILLSELGVYRKGNGHQEKKDIAQKLVVQLVTCQLECATQRCLAFQSYLKEAQRSHLNVIIKHSLSSSDFGEMLHKALSAFSTLAEKITFSHMKKIAHYTQQSLAVLAGKEVAAEKSDDETVEEDQDEDLRSDMGMKK